MAYTSTQAMKELEKGLRKAMYNQALSQAFNMLTLTTETNKAILLNTVYHILLETSELFCQSQSADLFLLPDLLSRLSQSTSPFKEILTSPPFFWVDEKAMAALVAESEKNVDLRASLSIYLWFLRGFGGGIPGVDDHAELNCLYAEIYKAHSGHSSISIQTQTAFAPDLTELAAMPLERTCSP